MERSQNAPNPSCRWLTRREAAEYGRIGVSTLAKLAIEGKGPPVVKIGRSVRYPLSDFDSWIRAHQINASEVEANHA